MASKLDKKLAEELEKEEALAQAQAEEKWRGADHDEADFIRVFSLTGLCTQLLSVIVLMLAQGESNIGIQHSAP